MVSFCWFFSARFLADGCGGTCSALRRLLLALIVAVVAAVLEIVELVASVDSVAGEVDQWR